VFHTSLTQETYQSSGFVMLYIVLQETYQSYGFVLLNSVYKKLTTGHFFLLFGSATFVFSDLLELGQYIVVVVYTRQ